MNFLSVTKSFEQETAPGPLLYRPHIFAVDPTPSFTSRKQLPLPTSKLHCRFCGDPLPARQPGQMGRPPVTHPGDCRRLAHNAASMNARVARFRAAHRLVADRSSVGDVIMQTYDYDEIAEGYGNVDPDPYRGLWGRPLMDALELWEATGRCQKLLDRADRARAIARFDALSPAEQDAEIVRLVARRRAR